MKKEKQNQVAYKGNSIRLSADFSEATLQATREWWETFKVLKERNLQLRIGQLRITLPGKVIILN